MVERPIPTGTVTFMFTDIEGSTRLVQDLGPAAFAGLLDRHNAILRAVFASHDATERGTQGDSFFVAFRDAPGAVVAAAEAQRGLAAERWPGDASIRVRMGIHAGAGTLGGDDYVSIDVNRAARIASAAHGGQVIVSDAVRALAEGTLPPDIALLDLGEHKLKDLARPERLHQLVIDGLPREFPPLHSLDATPGNVPQRLTSFVGRETELAQLSDLLRANRLVTLVGPGGTGKTSLSGELARAEAARYERGAWFASLESVGDPSLVAGTIAASLGTMDTGQGAVVERVAAFFEGRSALLVIDNFEQVLPAAPFVRDLLAAAPGLRIVVTSRAPLRLSVEQEFPVPPLPVPGSTDTVESALANPCVRLFVERAARLRPGYRPTDADLPAIAEICRRLDGLPLGIELAASRMGVLPPRAIAERLARTLDLPGTGSRDLPERQRTLEAAMAWSYDLLGVPERRLLARLSVFAGGCTLEEADAVCGPPAELGVEVIEGLSTLVGQSLVQAAADPDGARFVLYDTIRQFAAERLAASGETADLRRRHAYAYLALAEATAPHLPGRDQVRLLDRLGLEHDNLRAAVDHAIDVGDAELALRLGAALWRFWQIRGHLAEAESAMARIMAVPGAEAPTARRAAALDAAGSIAWWRGDTSVAHRYYLDEVDLARRLGDDRVIADALFNLAHTSLQVEGPDVAQAIRDEAIDLYRALGDERAVARAHWIIPSSAIAADPAGSQAAAAALLERFQDFDDDFYAGMAHGILAWAHLYAGEPVDAIHEARETLRLAHAMGDVGSTAVALFMVAIVFLRGRLPVESATAFGAYEALSARYGVRPQGIFLNHAQRWWDVTMLESALGSDGYREARARGAAMTAGEAVDYVTGINEEPARSP